MSSLDFEAEKAAFRTYYDHNAALFDGAKASFLTLIRSLLAGGDYASAVTSGRIKDREESIKKFVRKYQGDLEKNSTPYDIKSHITDLIGLRLVCLYEDEIEPIGALVRKQFDVLEVTDKIAQIEGTENAFGYKGLHLDLKLGALRAEMPEYAPFAPFRFELQIRTIIQDSWSALDHKIKYKKSIPAGLRRRINTLAALFELADREFRQVRDATQAEIEKARVEDNATDAEHIDGASAGKGDSTKVEPGQFASLNAFRFLRIANHFFPDFEFEPQKVDGFTAEIIEREPEISRSKFNFYLRENISLVRRYKVHFLRGGLGEQFNAFTEMRHCLYAANPDPFSSMLTNTARETFDNWRQGEATHAEEIQNTKPAVRRTQKR
ncbi:MAG: (p)ppGpp synthetase [Steroidobacteraceae bacterium]|nr:(p)ppGpp synthetase [Steroidobacteraceae bacterium]